MKYSPKIVQFFSRISLSSIGMISLLILVSSNPSEAQSLIANWKEEKHTFSRIGKRLDLTLEGEAVPPERFTKKTDFEINNQIQISPSFPETAPVAPNSDIPNEISQPTGDQQLELVTPTRGEVKDVPSTTVTLKYPLGAEITLTVNGKVVDDSFIGRIAKDERTGQVLQTWYGVGLEPSEVNIIVANGTLEGQPLTPVKREVSVRQKPTEISLEAPAELKADGRTTGEITGQLLDEQGNRSNYNAVITLSSSAGTFVDADAKPSVPGFQVEAKQGRFSAQLQTGIEAQTVRIQAESLDLQAFTTLRFAPNLRKEALATGFINFRLGRDNTNFYDSFQNFLPLDEDQDTEFDVTGAGFITGTIGEWQYSSAINTDHSLNRNSSGETALFGRSSSDDRVYETTGDDSNTDLTTPSSDSFFFRIERSSPVENAPLDYGMWGDYRIAEFNEQSQDFSSFSRTLHGFKGSYNWGDLKITGFYADNVEGLQRDIIAPDGTRGFFFLSRRNLVEGSEEIYVEIEELENPGRAVRREQLRRGRDYEIDYDRGSIFLDRPLLRTFVNDEGEVMVRKLVATYEFENNGGEASLSGGRLQYHFSRNPDRESWLGATYIEENRGEEDFSLFGVDSFISLGTDSYFIAEYAYSQHNVFALGEVDGSAYRLETVATIAPGITTRAYFEETDSGFSNNTTGSFVPGQTRYGAELNGQVTETTSARFRYERQENQGVAPRPLTEFGDLLQARTEPVPGSEVDNELTSISAGVQQRIGDANLSIDWIYRNRKDRISPQALESSSSQLRSFLDVPVLDDVSLQVLNTTTLSSSTDAVFSDRTSLGVTWDVFSNISLKASQTWFTRGQLAGESITSIGLQGDYDLGENTTISGRYSLENDRNGTMGVGSFGIDQGIVISSGLKIDLGFEHVFTNDNRFRSGSGVQFSQVAAVGDGSSSLGSTGGTSYNVGISYTDSPDFNASLRWESFKGNGRENTVITANASGNITPGLTGLLSYNRSGASNQGLELDPRTSLKMGLAYRDPHSDEFNALLRYEYRRNPSIIPESLLVSRGSGSEEHLFSIEAIYAPDFRWEFYGKFALRNGSTDFAQDFTATSHITLTQLRATHRLGEAFDLVGEVRWIDQPSASFSEVGWVTEVGYMITPELRLAAGYVFGSVDDRDFEGLRSSEGAYIGVTVKLQGIMDLF